MKEFKLDTAPKISTGFKTPEHYFDTLSEKVIVQLPEKESKVISIFRNKKHIILMVAAIFVLALLVPVLFSNLTKSNELDDSTIENYLSYQSNVTQYDIINLLDTEDIDHLKSTVNVDLNEMEMDLILDEN
ncbi:hypothetical protein SLW70_16565 [Flavobacterium sp. NG2]|uniref:hypothetical protein n=1 Tax=Flavobacterium sp. NG2 TaxID=3097547 RepID=UPI002A83050F|nr:hypothetical protein [Flavobacterium sp. NG2]WPR71527.1 hypothetical protein SLW70_16565 [Flavobacterium sp. NG2]